MSTNELLKNTQALLQRVIKQLPDNSTYDNLALHCENQIKAIDKNLQDISEAHAKPTNINLTVGSLIEQFEVKIDFSNERHHRFAGVMGSENISSEIPRQIDTDKITECVSNAIIEGVKDATLKLS